MVKILGILTVLTFQQQPLTDEQYLNLLTQFEQRVAEQRVVIKNLVKKHDELNKKYSVMEVIIFDLQRQLAKLRALQQKEAEKPGSSLQTDQPRM